ncbi:carboxyl transferase domain-containing protein [Anaeromyxobacter sp. Fw109-5]|uniref:carboxyl transferase domain-containing protein n=1 Tax=Anaeromyxobacter sp. (strain Fw109-5) TaxID=404589 RepID=UPI0000ED7FEA|nr:carboxyl transferase domain-containing protein [Anaeromyxobacter sp. Fw109-5]ABS27111.1 biotin/lipoyl attachment domain-containing protein [Anaeromyxobacter sp. Fw109-5]
MHERNGLGRVAVVDPSEAARRVVRAVRALGREGLADGAVVVHAAEPRRAPAVREADEAVEALADVEETLRRARADAAWLGPAPVAERAAFAEACARAGVTHVGPPADALRWLAAPGALSALAERVGVLAGEAAGLARRIEVVVARDRAGAARVIGVGDASLRAAGTTSLVESPPAGLAPEVVERARSLGLSVAAEAGWVGVCGVELAVDAAGRISLSAIGATPASAPAVEEANGADLVRLALRLAAGQPLDAAAPPPAAAHALAARVVAAGAPAGRVEVLRLPSGPGVRTDAALDEGDDAPAGAVIATVIARAEERREALERLVQALAESDVLLRGAAPSTAWLRALCGRAEIRAGRFGAGLLDALSSAGEPAVPQRPEVAVVAAALEAYDAELDLERARFIVEARRGRPRVGPSSGRSIELRHGGRRHRLDVRQVATDAYRVVQAGGAPLELRVERLGAHERRLAWRGGHARLLVASDGRRQLVQVDGVPHVVRLDPAGVVASPLPAVVVAIPVAPGQRVSAGEPIARVESMKVEMVVPAPYGGVVREVLAVPNAQVDTGAPLVRLDPEGEGAPEPAAPPLSLAAAAPVEPADAGGRYLVALAELQRLVLGFDVSTAEARRLAAAWRELAGAAPHGDASTLRAESAVVAAFADVQSLYGRARPAAEDGGAKPPLEELWRYLHEPEARGAGLAPSFVTALRRALSHYGLSLEVPGGALEVALLRMQKAYERAEEQLAPLLGILERWLAAPDAPAALAPREQLDRLAAVGEERFRALADLAREVRYRRHDQPGIDRLAAETYAQAEADLARLQDAEAAEREALVERIVQCPQSIATLLVSRMAEAAPPLRARLVETLLRRYYRDRALGPVELGGVEGLACAWADYDLDGQRFRVIAAFALPGELDQSVRRLARLAAEVPADRAVAVELYVWHDGPVEGPDAAAERLRAALTQAAFTRALRRASFLLAIRGRGLGRQASQEHFTFRGGPAEWIEDRRHRGVHPMLFKRMQLGRLAGFELERLPSVEDVYLYRGVAREAPRDERLFAVAEVRAIAPVRDASGRVVQMPHVERMLHEALAGMRRFQARRAPGQRLEWNRVLLTVGPPLPLTPEEIRGLADRMAPAAAGLGLEMVLIDARIPDPATGEPRRTLLRFLADDRGGVSIRWDEPTDRPLEPMAEYEQRVVQLRRRGLTHPFEIVKLLAPPRGGQSSVPPGEFVEHDLDAGGALAPVDRPPGKNAANVVAGTVRSFTPSHPEGMLRVVLLGDPSRAMGSLAEPECRRIEAALALAERLGVPLEWFAVSAGARISMESGTENMDWISRVLRRIVEFTQRGGELNVIVVGINVGAQPYWNAEATMLMHTRGILVMTPGSAMVLTGKEALEYSGSVSAEDNRGIGGYERIMGPNGQAQYQAGSVAEAIDLLMRHYAHAYVVPGERFPRRVPTADPLDRDVRSSPHGPEGGAGFDTIGDVFSAERNPDRKKPFDIRRVMAACVDQDHPPLERWPDLRGGETAVVWDAHLGGFPVCLVGIESRPLPRLEFVPADGPELWSAGTLFPQSSKKIARALSSASGNRPVVVLANLSGFDGSPESMRRLQLEYGAEIGRAVVNFRGPIVFCVVSRYHGGAFVVFSKALRDDMEVVAVEGARASVIGGAPAAAVVFAREVDTRARKDPRVLEAERAAAAGGSRLHLEDVLAAVRAEKVGEVAEEFDAIHTVERALRVGSLDRVIPAGQLRPYLVDAVARGIARAGR